MGSLMTVVVLNRDLNGVSKRQAKGLHHRPLRSVAKKRGPASRISTHGRGEFGRMKERQELPPRPVSLYTRPLLKEGR